MIRQKYLLIFCLISISPFLYLVGSNVVQSYPDFFISGSRNLLETFFSWSDSNFGINASGELWRSFPLASFYYLLTSITGISIEIAHPIILALIYLVGLIAAYSFLLNQFQLEKSNKKHVTAASIGALFYVFNTYSLTQLSGSFLLVIPYLFLPVQLLLFLRGLHSQAPRRHLVLLALTNAFVFGVNLVFAFISIVLVTIFGIWEVFVNKRGTVQRLLKNLLLSGAVTLGLISFWFAPLIYSSLIDKGTTQYVLQSENFYNNDSSVANVLRGLGDWGFFASNKGIPYREFAVQYKNNPLVILSGYLFPVIAILVALGISKMKPPIKRNALLFWILLILILPLVGGTHPTWPTSSTMNWFFENVPYFKALRNTYKLATVLMLGYAAILTVFLATVPKAKSKKGFWANFVLAGVVCGAIIINAFPYFSGQVFSSNTMIGKIPNYWRDASKYVNSNFNNQNSRIIMMPSQYFEVFNWSDGGKFFQRNIEEFLFKVPSVHQTCNGCGQYHTSTLLSYLYDNINNPNLSYILGIAGISNIVQRNDFDYKYYDSESPQEIKAALRGQNNIHSVRTFGELDLYEINGSLVNKLFYSPSIVTSTSKFDEISDVAKASSLNVGSTTPIITSQLKSDDDISKLHVNYYKRIFDLDEVKLTNQVAANYVDVPRDANYTFGPSGINRDNPLSYRIRYQYNAGNYRLILEPVKNNVALDETLIGQPQASESVDVDLGNYGQDSIVVEIADKAFLLLPNRSFTLGTTRVNANHIAADVYRTTGNLSQNLLRNPSFEQGLWQQKAQNCRRTSSNADIKMDLVKKDSTDGESSILLSSKEDAACTSSPSLDNFKPGIYLFSYDAKNIVGSLPAYCAWDGRGCVSYSREVNDGKWQSYNHVVKMNPGSSNFFLYFYAQKSNFEQTKNAYDNVRIYRLDQPDKHLEIAIPNSDSPPVDYKLRAGRHSFTAQVSRDGSNLLDNGSFEDGLWSKQVSNCTEQGSPSGISMKRTNDSQNGKYALELSSRGDTACTSSDAIRVFSKDALYSLSFKVNIVEGNNARVCVWDSKQCVLSESVKKTNRGWQQFEAVVRPRADSEALSVFLYATGGKGTVRVRYDDVSIFSIENNFLSTYNLTNTTPVSVEAAKLTATKIDLTTYFMTAKTSSTSLLVFQQSFHPGWRAYVMKDSPPKGIWQNAIRSLGFWNEYEIPRKNHIITTGFGNGWWFESNKLPAAIKRPDGKYKIIVEYWPQRLVWWGLVVSALTLLACFSYLGYAFVKPKKGNLVPGGTGRGKYLDLAEDEPPRRPSLPEPRQQPGRLTKPKRRRPRQL